jgi:phosphopantetheine--protein transferase-like protein
MHEVLGCGIDVEELIRFRTKIPEPDVTPGFAKIVYTPDEISQNLHIRPESTFPLCFSCKEAFFKALGVSWTNSSISWQDIELLFRDKNNLHDYAIHVKGTARKMLDQLNCIRVDSDFELTDEWVVFQIVLCS